MDIVPCNNHTCTARFDKANDEYHTCALCLQPAYCSDECRLMDWRAHDCPNVHKTEDIKQGFAVPYYYEDMLTAEELDEVPVSDPIFQNHQVMHCNANRTISEYMVPSLVEKNAESKDDEAPIARGMNPSRLPVGRKYELDINIGDRKITMPGTIPKDMIYLENNANPTARAISGGGKTFGEKVKNIFKGDARRLFHHQSTSYIFWPNNAKLRAENVQVPLSGDVSVALYIMPESGNDEGTRVSYLFAGYKLPSPGKSDISGAARKVQQMFRSQLEMKFKDTGLSTKNMYVRRYADFEGNGIVLTFVVVPGSVQAQLVDVEYMANTSELEYLALSKSLEKTPPPPERDDSEIISSRFACDVRNFEEVVGLAMALDTFIASPPTNVSSSGRPLDLRDLEAKSAIIKEYAHKMQDNQGEAPTAIPPEVDTAIMVALNTMYEPIGMSQSQWDKKAMGTFDNFKADVDKIVARVKELRSKSAAEDPSKLTGKAKRGLRNLFQKKPLLADLDRILKAIDKRTGSFGEDGASEETKKKWNDLREEVVQAKRSGVM